MKKENWWWNKTELTILKAGMFITAFMFLIFFLSCENDPNQKIKPEASPINGIVEVDGCEYLLFSGSHNKGVIHKGNCKNLIHNK